MGVDLIDIAAKRAELTPERIAFVDVLSGETRTYRQLNARATRCANALEGLGVAAGDRVAVLCRNRIEFFEIQLACAKVGAILAPLNWRMPPGELGPVLEDCEPVVLFYGGEDAMTAAAVARGGMRLVALDPADGEGACYGALLTAASAERQARAWPADDAWCLLYTSGTTGTPKAVIQTYQMALVNHVNASHAFGLRDGDHTLNFLPLFHAAGIHLLSLPTLFAGGTVHVLSGFDADVVIQLIASRQVDVFFGVPAVYQQLSLHPRFDEIELTHVRAWGCGGAPLPDVLAERFAAKGVLVCNGYGMTETGPTAFVAAPQDALAKIGSVGRPQLLLEARIVDSGGREAEVGDVGEIWMRGPGVTPGYWRRPEETARTFSPDGWLKSGDLGRRDPDGCFYVVGRIKEMYISGGENVYPAEVENVLARHSAVLEAAVVAAHDEKWGEVGHAFVMLRPGAPKVDGARLIHFCRRHLAAYKAPRYVTIVEDFPRTPSGKVQKHLLREPERVAP
ncbi:MAG TPA: AMP-binding protein [Caulobacterales bacterium]|nr:AMP-binding protein [Caulobacterales bacterium]